MNFDDIRPYGDTEIKEILAQLLDNPAFIQALHSLLQQQDLVDFVIDELSQIDNVFDIQSRIMRVLLRRLFKANTNGEICTGTEKLDSNKAYIFISNHRDIILDAAFVNVLLLEQLGHTVEIAIGSNLLIHEWIEQVFRCNRAFIVKRNIPLKEMVVASRKLSAYIRQTITERKESIWIAQREGRTKDGHDQTQVALLKMLNMSNPHNFTEGFNELQIVPLSISYEIEPCGRSKVVELLSKAKNPDYRKSLEDDLQAMDSSMKDHVGRVSLHFCEPIDIQKLELENYHSSNERLQQLAKYIDQQIYTHYQLWPNNYIAYDRLFNTQKYKAHYNADDEQKFESLTAAYLKNLAIPRDELNEYWLRMYAQPVLNFEQVAQAIV